MKISCSCCFKVYEAKPYKARQPKHYCSISCKNTSMRRSNTEPCEFCGEPVTRRKSSFRRNKSAQVFCSRTCATRWRGYNTKQIRISDYGPHNKEKHAVMYGRSCFLCGFDRFVEFCHIIPASIGGTAHPSNIVALCPNHHTLMDRDLLTEDEEIKLDDIIIYAWATPAAARFPDISRKPSSELERATQHDQTQIPELEHSEHGSDC